MRGDLTRTSAADACRDLARQGATGLLAIEGPDGPGSVSMVDGRVVAASSPTPRARLGDRLVGASYLDEQDLADALRLQRTGEGHARLGVLLVDRGLVSRDAVRLFIQEQLLDALFDVLRWRYGTFEFIHGEATEVLEIPLSLAVDDVLVEVARRQQEWEQVSQLIPDLEAIPNFRAGASSAAASLEPDEFAVLASVDGERSVRALAGDLGYGEFEAARIIYGLCLLGIVEIELPEDEVGAAFDDAFSGPGDEDDASAETAPTKELSSLLADLASGRDAAVAPDQGTPPDVAETPDDLHEPQPWSSDGTPAAGYPADDHAAAFEPAPEHHEPEHLEAEPTEPEHEGPEPEHHEPEGEHHEPEGEHHEPEGEHAEPEHAEPEPEHVEPEPEPVPEPAEPEPVASESPDTTGELDIDWAELAAEFDLDDEPVPAPRADELGEPPAPPPAAGEAAAERPVPEPPAGHEPSQPQPPVAPAPATEHDRPAAEQVTQPPAPEPAAPAPVADQHATPDHEAPEAYPEPGTQDHAPEVYPETVAQQHAPDAPPAEPAPAEPAPEEPAEPAPAPSAGGDVSEFLRELSRLALDSDEESKPAPVKRSASSRPPVTREEEKPKKRGLFGWGS